MRPAPVALAGWVSSLCWVCGRQAQLHMHDGRHMHWIDDRPSLTRHLAPPAWPGLLQAVIYVVDQVLAAPADITTAPREAQPAAAGATTAAVAPAAAPAGAPGAEAPASG
jgi:hypothetical protein